MRDRLACVGREQDRADLKFSKPIWRDEGEKKFGKMMRHYGLFQTCHPRIALSRTDLPITPSKLVWWAAAQCVRHFILRKRFKATGIEGFHEPVDQGIAGHEGLLQAGIVPDGCGAESLVETP